MNINRSSNLKLKIMKTAFRKLIVALVFVASFAANASDGLDLKVNEKQNLIVEVKGIEQGAILSILGENEEIVFKDRLSNDDSYSKIFDFNSLEDGRYTLVLDKEFSISTSIISKKGEILSIEKNAYRFDFKPLYRISGDIVSICLANPEENKVEIEIFDKFGVPVGKLKTKDLVVKRKLDFSEVPAGSYIVKIKTKTNTFSKSVNVG